MTIAPKEKLVQIYKELNLKANHNWKWLQVATEKVGANI